jgi:hydrogenase nickel incorporation protein HypA/HybF
MHELSIADAIGTLALEHAAGRRVRRVHLVVGHLRQVVPAALTFSWELLTQGTLAEGAVLELEVVPIDARCRTCAVESRQSGFPLQCPACRSLDLDVVRGEELLVEWVECVEESAEAAPLGAGP